jgi:ZIP family zinc transporter
VLIAIALATFVSTFLGGLFALRFRDKLHLILGFSAGAVTGVAFFHLLPESLALGHDLGAGAVTTLVAAGFLCYLVLDRLVQFHPHQHGELHADCNHDHSAQRETDPRGLAARPGQSERSERYSARPSSAGYLGAASMCLHSFVDGVAVGLGFQVSATVGSVVALAVLAHKFSDGINTVGFLLKGGAGPRLANRWLLVAAAAPVLGVASTQLFSVPDTALGALLAVFTGFFIYIGASELIPESYHSHPKFLTTLMTVLGIAAMFVIVQLAHGSGANNHIH